MAVGLKAGAAVQTPPMGASYLWGLPQMPEFLEYPFFKSKTFEPYPLFFVGQVACAEAAPFDRTGLLPDKGFLWFFADLDYYMGYTEDTERRPGRWDRKAVQVLYSHVSREELSHEFLTFPAETDMMPPEARLLSFGEVPDDAPGAKLLGVASDPEAAAAFAGDGADGPWQLLLQLPADEDLDAGFCFFVERAALADRKFRRAEGFLVKKFD